MVKPHGSFSLSVDFGTTNTLVFAKDAGVVVNQATLLALRSEAGKTQSFKVLGAGSSVSPLIGRTAPLISVEAPLASGVIRDTELAKILLHELISNHLPWSRHIPLPHRGRGILISAPREVTEYERSAFQDAARSLGFASVGVVDEPLSAALGSGLPLFAPQGQMLVDLGSGITEAIIMSSGMVVESGSFRQGGNDVDQEIVDYLENQHSFKIALGHARDIKERFGAVGTAVREMEIQLQGKCLKTKLPRKRSMTAGELSLCLNSYVDRVQRLILDVMEKADPELVSDVLEGGVWLSGGGALLPGLSAELERRLNFAVRAVENPLGAVIAGNGMIVNEPGYATLCRTVS
jgi:rod shape-determining protein MreB